jgi:hypothetical protein
VNAQKEMNKHMFLILLVAGSWVVGSLTVGHHYQMVGYLYTTNTLAAGKFITTMFTGRPWN